MGAIKHTNVEQNSAVQLLVDDVGLQHLVVERLRGSIGDGHLGGRLAVGARQARRGRQLERKRNTAATRGDVADQANRGFGSGRW